jgi:tRNA U34 5-carboxymethylaminomethyl modifying GTPase MnmE/TrmE
MYIITVAGSSAVGKTSIINLYMNQANNTDVKMIESNNRFDFEKSDAVLFVFDLTSESSLYNIEHLYRVCKSVSRQKCLHWLIGNKNDETRSIEMKKCTQFARNKSMYYKEISTINNNDVCNTLDSIIKKIKADGTRQKRTIPMSDRCISQ